MKWENVEIIIKKTLSKLEEDFGIVAHVELGGGTEGDGYTLWDGEDVHTSVDINDTRYLTDMITRIQLATTIIALGRTDLVTHPSLKGEKQNGQRL